jgi:hypothetical protein
MFDGDPDLVNLILTALVFDSKTLIEANCDSGLILLIGKRGMVFGIEL